MTNRIVVAFVLSVLYQLDDVGNFPNMRTHACSHSGRDAQRLMDADEIVKTSCVG